MLGSYQIWNAVVGDSAEDEEAAMVTKVLHRLELLGLDLMAAT